MYIQPISLAFTQQPYQPQLRGLYHSTIPFVTSDPPCCVLEEKSFHIESPKGFLSLPSKAVASVLLEARMGNGTDEQVSHFLFNLCNSFLRFSNPGNRASSLIDDNANFLCLQIHLMDFIRIDLERFLPCLRLRNRGLG